MYDLLLLFRCPFELFSKQRFLVCLYPLPYIPDCTIKDTREISSLMQRPMPFRRKWSTYLQNQPHFQTTIHGLRWRKIRREGSWLIRMNANNNIETLEGKPVRITARSSNRLIGKGLRRMRPKQWDRDNDFCTLYVNCWSKSFVRKPYSEVHKYLHVMW